MFKWMVTVTDPKTGEKNIHRFEWKDDAAIFMKEKEAAGYVVSGHSLPALYYGGLNSH